MYFACAKCEHMLKITVTENTDQIKKRAKCLKYLQTHRVDVGLTSSASARSRFLLGIHTHGSPVMRIPPRPVIRPALAKPETRAAMAEAMKDAVTAAWEGEDPRPAMEAAGRAGAGGIRAYIDSHIPPPNSPVTVNGGWMYNRAAHKGIYVSGKGFNKPLFDTGALYDAFDYEIGD